MNNSKNIIKKIIDLFHNDVFRKVLFAFIVVKLIIIVAALSSNLVPAEYSLREVHLSNGFLNLFAQYDGSAYLDIIKNGYNDSYLKGAGNFSFYPFYPLLIYLFSFIFGVGLSALLISNFFSLISLCLLYILVEEEFGKVIAKKATLYLVFFPMVYFFTMMYTESLFFTLILLMFYYARRGNWLAVGLIGFLASFTRMFGIVMFFPMLYMYLEQKKVLVGYDKKYWFKKKINLKKLDFEILYLLLIPLSIFMLFSYFYITTGDFLKQFHTFAKPIYGFSAAVPGLAYPIALVEIFTTKSASTIFYNTFNIALSLYFFYATFIWLKRGGEYAVYMIFYILLALSHSGILGNTRYFMLMFPAFILLAQQINEKNKWHRILLTLLMIAGITFMIIFTIWHANQGILVNDWIRNSGLI